MPRYRTLLICGWLVLASACGAESGVSVVADTAPSSISGSPVPPTTDVSGPPYLGPLTFDWPTGCTVPVSEEVVKGNDAVELSYGLQLVEEGANMVVSLVDMTMVSVNGQLVPREQSDTVAAAFRLPAFVVDEHGVVVEVRGIDELMDQAAAITGQTITPEVRPAMADVLEQTVTAKYWDTWAGFWATFGPIDQPHYDSVVSTPIGESSFDTQLGVDSLGVNSEGLAVLTTEQVVEGEDLTRALAGTVETLAGADQAPAELTTASGSRVTRTATVTDPVTLRPSRAALLVTTELTSNGETHKQGEDRRWYFDWQASDCAAPPA